jgi:hypothetical protein
MWGFFKKSGVNKSGDNGHFLLAKMSRGNVKENDELNLLIFKKEPTNVGYKVLKRREKLTITNQLSRYVYKPSSFFLKLNEEQREKRR